MKRLSWTLVALVAAGVFLFVVAVPPAPVRVDAPAGPELAARTVAGAYHIHTTRSDGIGDRNAVAAAAARAGLAFAILADHGDGTRPPDPPVYLEGVLILAGVEISTDDGHYVAIEMRGAPYPLGGAADAVVEDVARLGGFGIAAHPDSPKTALRWTDDRARIDGIEWLNADSEWRGEPRTRLLRAGLGYFLRPGPAVASLFDRPSTLDRWDRLTEARPVVALAGADAHGGTGRRAEDSNRSLSGTIGIPSYEASFAAFSNRVVLDRPLTGHAAEDARALFGAIRKGSVFTAIDALAGPAVLDFHVEAGLQKVGMGSVMAGGADAAIVALAPQPRGAELLLLRDGREIARGRGEIRHAVTGARGAYRVEARMPGAPGTPPVPWLVSNPIYFGDATRPGDEGVRDATAPSVPGQTPAAPFPWRIEKDPSSSGVLRAGASEHALPPPAIGHDAAEPVTDQARDQLRFVREQHRVGRRRVAVDPRAPRPCHAARQLGRHGARDRVAARAIERHADPRRDPPHDEQRPRRQPERRGVDPGELRLDALARAQPVGIGAPHPHPRDPEAVGRKVAWREHRHGLFARCQGLRQQHDREDQKEQEEDQPDPPRDLERLDRGDPHVGVDLPVVRDVDAEERRRDLLHRARRKSSCAPSR